MISETAYLADHELPQKPLVVIDPDYYGYGPNLRELWEYRELLYFLIWRDVKVRYKQTLLGVVWVILQPLVMMAILTIFFGRLAGVPSDNLPYPLFVFAGLLPWVFFSTAVNMSSNSINNSAGLITKVYFPRLIVPISAVCAVLLDLAIALIVLAALMLYWRITPGPGVLMIAPLILLITTLALGLGILASALNVKYRDVKIALPFVIQVWFFVSPIIYPLSIVPARWRWLMAFNPITGIAEGFRAALNGHTQFDWRALAFSSLIAAMLLAYAVFIFKRMERVFADIV